MIRLRCPTSMRTGLMPKVSRGDIDEHDGRGGQGCLFFWGIMLTLVSIVRRLDYPFRSDRGPQDLL